MNAWETVLPRSYPLDETYTISDSFYSEMTNDEFSQLFDATMTEAFTHSSLLELDILNSIKWRIADYTLKNGRYNWLYNVALTIIEAVSVKMLDSTGFQNIASKLTHWKAVKTSVGQVAFEFVFHRQDKAQGKKVFVSFITDGMTTKYCKSVVLGMVPQSEITNFSSGVRSSGFYIGRN